MLKTLGYRIPAAHLDSLLGDVAVQVWDDSFAEAWQRLPQRSLSNGRPSRPAYRQLRTGLAAVHGRPIHIVDEWKVPAADKRDGVKGMLISAGAISPFHLSTSLRTFERMLRGGDDRDSLAPLLTPADTTRRFSDYVSTHESGTVDAPGWLFETATWAVVSRLAQPLLLEDDGTALSLRLDTDGSLLAWDHPASNEWGSRSGHAMLRIRSRIVTLPQVSDLAIVFDAHLSRIGDSWRGNKSAWIGRKDPSKPVLKVPIRTFRSADTASGFSQEIADFGAAIAESCGVEPLSIDEELTAVPGRVRPLIPKPGRHPIGKGPGARVMLRLAEHVDALCPELEPLTWSRDPRTRVRAPRRQILNIISAKKNDLPVGADTIAAAIRAANGGTLRLLCLYSTSEARSRMSAQLEQLGAGSTPAVDGEITTLSEGLDVSFHRLVDLLRHGDHQRTELLGDVEKIAKEVTGTLLALVETEYDADEGKPKNDAKNPVKRLLATYGIATQFIATSPPDDGKKKPGPSSTKAATARQKVDAAKDYAASSAAADLLLRNAGVIHPELGTAILGGFLADTAHQKVQLVGLHIRSQTGRSGPTRLVATSVAIGASAIVGDPWPVRMWNDKSNCWTSYPQATASFHAGDIGSKELGRGGQKMVDTRFYIESLMDSLPAGPVVLFVDAVSARGFWPGLQNQRFGDALLPAVNLSMLRDVAIVRCNASREAPRPVDREGGHQPILDSRQPASPDRSVYREKDSRIWLFPKSSRVYRSNGGAIGARYTPWTLPENLRHLLKEDWHAYTGTEIAVPRAACWDEVDLVTLTARLCDHTLAWDDRTVAPLPLHLASRVDLTHPDYRSDDPDD